MSTTAANAAAALRPTVAVWFEIPAENYERAIGFYETIFAEFNSSACCTATTPWRSFPYERPGVSGCIVPWEGGAGSQADRSCFSMPTASSTTSLARVVKPPAGTIERAAARPSATAWAGMPESSTAKGIGSACTRLCRRCAEPTGCSRSSSCSAAASRVTARTLAESAGSLRTHDLPRRRRAHALRSSDPRRAGPRLPAAGATFEIPPLMFERHEIEALVAGARMVEAWAGPALAEPRHARP